MLSCIIAGPVAAWGNMLPSYAFEGDPYDSGYDHGCDDAGISDSSDRYINQPEKGPAIHTDRFMEGYNAGFNACTGSNSDGGRSEEFSSEETSSNQDDNYKMIICAQKSDYLTIHLQSQVK